MKRARRRHGAQPVDDLLGEDVWDPALDDYDLEADDDGICALGAALADLEAMARARTLPTGRR